MESSASVLTIETTDRKTDSLSYRAFKGGKHYLEIQKISEIYQLLGKDPNGPFLDRFHDCSKFAWFVRHKETGQVRVRASACRIRWCPLCGEARQQFLTKQTKHWLDCMKHPKMLTLTIRHNDQPLTEQINHLYKSFQNLRKRKFWGSRVLGGIWFFQIKKSKKDGRWHPHIHCIVAGKFLLHSELKKLWQQVTGNSDYVDIRGIEDNEKSAKHVARYASKPGDVTAQSLDDAVEMVGAMKGRRLVGTFGNAKEVSLRPEKAEDSKDWETVGTWDFVINMADQNERANEILNAYFGKTPLPDGNSLEELERQVCNIMRFEERGPPVFSKTFFEDE